MTSNNCKHKNTYSLPDDWPTGETIEVCKDCGKSRAHWEQGASDWQMVNLEVARRELQEFIDSVVIEKIDKLPTLHHRSLAEVLIHAASKIKESAECLKESSAQPDGAFVHIKDERLYKYEMLLTQELINHYMIRFKSSPTAEYVTFACEQCEEEYRLPEDTMVCPICHSLEISSV